MLKTIKDFLEKRKTIKNAKKLLTLKFFNWFHEDYEETFKPALQLLINHYNEFLLVQTEAKKAEKSAYESMNIFNEKFDVNDLQKMFTNLDTIANNPKLTTDFYKNIAEQAKNEQAKK